MNLKRVLHYYWMHTRPTLGTQFVVMFGYGAAQIGYFLIAPLLFAKIIDVVTEQSPSPEVAEQLWFFAFWVLINALFYNAMFRLGDYVHVKTQSNILKQLHDFTFDRLTQHSYSFFADSFTGSLVAKTKRFVSSFETLHDAFIFNIWMAGVQLAAVLVALFYHSWVLGLAFMVWLFGFVFTTWYGVKTIRPKALMEAEANSKTTGEFADAISSILTVKMFATREREYQAFKKVTHDEERKRYATWFQNDFVLATIQGTYIVVFSAVITYIAIYLWLNEMISAGAILLIPLYIFGTFQIVWNLSKNSMKILTAFTDASEMVEIFDTPLAITDASSPESSRITNGHIQFNDVTFGYNESRTVFKDLSIDIKPGERVALVGHSGAGKTTITKLLLRFMDVTDGALTIDGQDIRSITQDDLRSSIAYVPQEPLLFHRSLRENIAYANPKASQDEIADVAKKAHAHEFISKLKDGYETLVGERGIKLSGGERQRVAIARAMLKDAPILVLDEATSSLDSISEKFIQDSFKELMKDHTTIVIAHRLSTIQQMDRILVFDEGDIVEQGTHAELLEADGVYKKLWESQTNGFITDNE